ncbi:Hypothetical predicted protein [Marmota monax]|uniref:Uncharacterized protein n=1 Tax=Marmota monax TaxID=9995 RepID=A0A5E4BV32_MARMO|nr:Hypothetical predicted protein [Marmota monax]
MHCTQLPPGTPEGTAQKLGSEQMLQQPPEGQGAARAWEMEASLRSPGGSSLSWGAVWGQRPTFQAAGRRGAGVSRLRPEGSEGRRQTRSLRRRRRRRRRLEEELSDGPGPGGGCVQPSSVPCLGDGAAGVQQSARGLGREAGPHLEQGASGCGVICWVAAAAPPECPCGPPPTHWQNGYHPEIGSGASLVLVEGMARAGPQGLENWKLRGSEPQGGSLDPPLRAAGRREGPSAGLRPGWLLPPREAVILSLGHSRTSCRWLPLPNSRLDAGPTGQEAEGFAILVSASPFHSWGPSESQEPELKFSWSPERAKVLRFLLPALVLGTPPQVPSMASPWLLQLRTASERVSWMSRVQVEVTREPGASGRGPAWLVARQLGWGAREAEVGGVGSQRLGLPEGAAFPARVGSMGCNYTAPGPEPAGRERELAGGGRGRGRGREGTHVTLIDSLGRRRARASGARSPPREAPLSAPAACSGETEAAPAPRAPPTASSQTPPCTRAGLGGPRGSLLRLGRGNYTRHTPRGAPSRLPIGPVDLTASCHWSLASRCPLASAHCDVTDPCGSAADGLAGALSQPPLAECAFQGLRSHPNPHASHRLGSAEPPHVPSAALQGGDAAAQSNCSSFLAAHAHQEMACVWSCASQAIHKPVLTPAVQCAAEGSRRWWAQSPASGSCALPGPFSPGSFLLAPTPGLGTMRVFSSVPFPPPIPEAPAWQDLGQGPP